LEVTYSLHGFRAVDAVHAPAVKAEPTKVVLDLSDVITPKIGGNEHQIAISELPRGFYEGAPGVRVTDSRGF
jgi:hypothetical protein